jgi:hypothetical protein
MRFVDQCVDSAALVGFAVGALAFAAAMFAMDCGAGATTCAVIDLAHSACETLPIRYLGPDGKVHVAHVPAASLRAAALRAESVSADAGVAP